MRIFVTSLLLSISIVFAEEHDPFSRSSRHLADAAFQLKPKDENWLFSPISTSACMAMVTCGAAGQTSTELCKSLYLDENSIADEFHHFLNRFLHRPAFDRDFQITLVQGIWSQYNFPFLDSFMNQMQSKFLAEIESINFDDQSIQKINAWVEQNTQHKIQNLLNPNDIDSQTRLILANAIYFQGCWKKPFLEYNTSPQPFYSLNNVKEVPFMHLTDRFPYYEDDHFQAILLKINKSNSSAISPGCLFILPKLPSSPPISINILETIIENLRSQPINLQIPKFTLESRQELSNLFQALGAMTAFSPMADFSRMDGKRDLLISRILQKCYFSIDEKGLVASAATAAVMSLSSCPPSQESISMILDHPFSFYLIDEASRTCLIVGYLTDPE